MKYFIVYRRKVHDSRLFNCELNRVTDIHDLKDITEIERKIASRSSTPAIPVVIVNWRLFE